MDKGTEKREIAYSIEQLILISRAVMESLHYNAFAGTLDEITHLDHLIGFISDINSVIAEQLDFEIANKDILKFTEKIKL